MIELHGVHTKSRYPEKMNAFNVEEKKNRNDAVWYTSEFAMQFGSIAEQMEK